jgi:hypothetical protein
MSDPNQVASRIATWPYSGRGERRPQTARAARTNSPLEPPEALRGKGHTPIGRRWRDLCCYYGNRLGAARLYDEGTRARLLALIQISLELERIRDATVGSAPMTPSTLHLVQEQRTLLQELGLSVDTRRDDELARALRDSGSGEFTP